VQAFPQDTGQLYSRHAAVCEVSWARASHSYRCGSAREIAARGHRNENTLPGSIEHGVTVSTAGVAEWERIISINLIGPFRACATGFAIFAEACGGRIVNAGLVAGTLPMAVCIRPTAFPRQACSSSRAYTRWKARRIMCFATPWQRACLEGEMIFSSTISRRL